MTKQEILNAFRSALDDAYTQLESSVPDEVDIEEDDFDYQMSEASDYIAELLVNIINRE
jgi:hypothetical protein